MSLLTERWQTAGLKKKEVDPIREIQPWIESSVIMKLRSQQRWKKLK